MACDMLTTASDADSVSTCLIKLNEVLVPYWLVCSVPEPEPGGAD